MENLVGCHCKILNITTRFSASQSGFNLTLAVIDSTQSIIVGLGPNPDLDTVLLVTFSLACDTKHC